MNELERMELKISSFLRWGVFLCGAVIGIGWILAFKSANDPFKNLQTYHQISLINHLEIAFMLEEWGRLLSFMGLGLLILLPVMRVFLSIILFLKQNEKTMALIGAMVLIGLLVSFSLGGVEN